MRKALVLSTLILAGCSAGYHGNHDITIRAASTEYTMAPHTYNILLSKIHTDNELSTETMPLYDNIITSDSKPELWDYILNKADWNNDKKITHHEAKCLEDVWIEEF